MGFARHCRQRAPLLGALGFKDLVSDRADIGETDFKILRPLAAFGRQSSYSLYVCHTPLLVLAAALLLRGARLSYSGSAMLMIAGLCAVAVAYGWIFSRLTEAHTDAVRRWVRTASRHVFGIATGQLSSRKAQARALPPL